jgi:hypothetical protein
MNIRSDQQEAAQSLYEQLLKAGVKLDHHESDLYAEKTPVSERIIRSYQFRSNVTVFRDNIDHNLWYDIPFAYSPFWEKRRSSSINKTAVAQELVKIAKDLLAATAVLRLLTLEDSHKHIFELPIVKSGSVEMLNSWARASGFKFVKDTSLFGGYWTDPETGDGYMFDTP